MPSSSARSRFPRSATTTCCSRSAPSRCADPTCIRRTTPTPGRVNVPVVLGHEFGGTIARTGRSVRGFRDGDRVVSETAAQICGECMQCRTGWYNLCPKRLGFGYGLDGAMAQYVRVPSRCLHRIPDSLPFDLACLAEPHAVAYQAMCVNSVDPPGRLGGRARSRSDRVALRAHGGTVGRRSADRRGARRPTVRGWRRRASSAPPTPSTCRSRASRSSSATCGPTAPTSSATPPARAVRSRTRSSSRVRTDRSPRSAGRRTSSPWT